MPYLETSQEWSHQSSLLLQARPATTRITTKYKILNPATKPEKPERKAPTKDASGADAPAAATGPKATLTLKTYDPQSGVCLKYRTTKAAEVGRLIAGLGKLGRGMAALPDIPDDVAMPDATAVDQAARTSTPVPESAPKDAKAGGQPGAGGGGKKKKKGKK